MTKTPRTVLVYALKQEFIEWMDCDGDLQEMLMDKISEFMSTKVDYLTEDAQYDYGLELLNNLSLR